MANHHRSSSGSFRSLSRHETYYLTGGDLFFLVEQVHFRVHRYFFERESPYFRKQLHTPASPGAIPKGAAESTAIILEESPEDFAKFLWVFYNPRYSLYKTSVSDWKVILHLAHKWDFAEIKKLVIRELEKLEFPDVDRIATYQNHNIDRNYLIRRYAALCEREEPLTLAEGMQLGMETTLMIARAREYARANPAADGTRSPTSASIREDEMQSLVRLLFAVKPPKPREDDGEDEAPITTNGSTSTSGVGTGTNPGGLILPPPPPPPVKPVVVIPTGKLTVTDTPTGKGNTPPTATPSPAPKVETAQAQAQAKGGKKGKKGAKAQGANHPSTITSPIVVPALLPPQNEEVKAEKGAVVEPLIDLGAGDASVEVNGNVGAEPEANGNGNGVVHGHVDDVKVDGDGETQSEKPEQSGEAGATDKTAEAVEPAKPDEPDVTGKVDGVDPGVTDAGAGGSEANKVDDAGVSL